MRVGVGVQSGSLAGCVFAWVRLRVTNAQASWLASGTSRSDCSRAHDHERRASICARGVVDSKLEKCSRSHLVATVYSKMGQQARRVGYVETDSMGNSRRPWVTLCMDTGSLQILFFISETFLDLSYNQIVCCCTFPIGRVFLIIFLLQIVSVGNFAILWPPLKFLRDSFLLIYYPNYCTVTTTQAENSFRRWVNMASWEHFA